MKALVNNGVVLAVVAEARFDGVSECKTEGITYAGLDPAVFQVVDIGDPSVVVGSTYAGGVFSPSLQTAQAAKAGQLLQIAGGKIAGGYPCTLNGVAETLQLRDDTDRTNWLTVKGFADDAIAAGRGATNCTTQIRTTANRQYTLTNQQMSDLMKSLRTWGAALQTNLWVKKDAIAAAVDLSALNAIDLTAGWP